jgi:hypothetical protein
VKVGDLVRYSREAPDLLWNLSGVVTESRTDFGLQQVRILWNDLGYNKRDRWYEELCLEVISESR